MTTAASPTPPMNPAAATSPDAAAMTSPGAAEIICVGTELLLGDILNSNAQYLAQQLAQLGIPHYYQTVVGDNPDRIRQAVAIAQTRARLLIFTGGLGPTPDDLTHETLASCFGVELVHHEAIAEQIRQRFASRGIPMSANNLTQALLPAGAEILPNPTGTAPGLLWQPQPGLVLMTFPGVPSEMKRMWTDSSVPYLQAHGWSQSTFVSRTLHFWGISESSLAEKVHPFFDQTNPTVAPYANHGFVKLRITAKADSPAAAQALIAPTEAQLRALLGLDCFGADGETLAAVVGQMLQTRGETLSVAESCTGGGIGQLLTAIPGSSAHFWGGIIAYDNRIKEQLLGVSPQTLASEGAVSAAVAEQMAQGARDRLQTTWAISVTGIAGPDGGSPDKPVGLVYLGLAGPNGFVTSFERSFGAQRGRDWIRNLSAIEGLDRLRRHLASL